MESFLYGGIAIDYYNIVQFVSQGECKYFHARIKRMNVDCIMENYIYAIKIALKYQDINWLDYLSGLIENPEVYKLLPEEYQKLMTKYYNDFWKE